MGKLTSEGLVEREGYLSLNELIALKDLANTLPENPRVLNIGAGMGTSALALLEAREDVIVHSIDTKMSHIWDLYGGKGRHLRKQDCGIPRGLDKSTAIADR